MYNRILSESTLPQNEEYNSTSISCYIVHFHIFFPTIKMGILLSFLQIIPGYPTPWSIDHSFWSLVNSLALLIMFPVPQYYKNHVIQHNDYLHVIHIYILYFVLIIKLFNHNHISQATCQQIINLMPSHHISNHYLVHIFTSSSFFINSVFFLNLISIALFKISGSYCRIPEQVRSQVVPP